MYKQVVYIRQFNTFKHGRNLFTKKTVSNSNDE